MLRMVNLFIALSFGVHREQLEHLIGLTWPRPFLLRPLDARFLTILAVFEVIRRLSKWLIYRARKSRSMVCMNSEVVPSLVNSWVCALARN